MFDLMTREFNNMVNDVFDGFDTFFGSPRQVMANPPYQKVPRDFGFASNMSVEITESPENYSIKAAVPGFKKEDMKLNVNGNTLVICAEKKSSEEKKDEKSGKVLYSNYNYSTVSRSFRLPEGVTKDDVTAKFNEGELIVTVKKPEHTEPQNGTVEIE